MDGAAARTHRPRDCHGLTAHEVVLLLGTDPDRGLPQEEAAARLHRYGRNVLPAAARSGPLARLLRQFHHPLIYILLVAAAVALAVGEAVDASVILGVVVANAVIGFVQEAKAEAALDALRALVRTHAQVVRDGRPRRVDSEELVPGDLVVIAAGEKVPADVRLLRPAELQIDESALTGESVPVAKDEAALAPATTVADRRNMVYSGTLATHGSGTGVVVATGSETELGEIHRLVGSAEVLATPLTRKLSAFSRLLAAVILALAAVTFLIGLLRGEDAVLTFTAAVALAVAAIPEGLPAVVTVTLAIGVSRMARRRAVIRRLPCVETLGSTTVICSDKTGTLTRNEMTVRAVWTPGGEYTVEGTGYRPDGVLRDAAGRPVPGGGAGPEPAGPGGDGAGPGPGTGDAALRWTLLAGAACNDARLVDRSPDGAGDGGRPAGAGDGGAPEDAGGDGWKLIGDPTEGALLVSAAKGGLAPAAVAERLPRLDSVPFSSRRQMMGTLHRDRTAGGEGGTVILVKGAPEGLLPRCTGQLDAGGRVRALDRAAVERAGQRMAREGLRVLATAVRPGRPDATGLTEDDLDGGLVLTGLQAMEDPPREAARDAIRSCHAAGIDVKMVTGDHAATATAIAGRLGLPTTGEGAVVTGGELAGLAGEPDPARYRHALRRARVLARVSPEQKLRMVEALQADDQVVAMTGDGVNDAPALRQADIGVAMGRSGTEVAKEASDAVLLDDDFATIEAAVEEGRGVFDNLAKFVVWILPTNMGQGLVILAAIATGGTLPVLPSQILWVNMTTAVLLGLTLAFEPREPDIMARAPRSPRQPLLTRRLTLRILLVGVLIVTAATGLFEWERAHHGLTDDAARTAAMNVIIAIQVCYLFSCRSLRRPAWRLSPLGNPWILLGVLLQILAQLLITYLPVMNALFHTEPLGAGTWLRVLALAAVASLVVAVDKRLRAGEF